MNAFLARIRNQAVEEWRGFKYALLCGVIIALATTALVRTTSMGTFTNVVVAIIGDSIGFYGCLAVAAYRNEVSPGSRRAWRTAKLMLRKYWLAELIDNWLRAGALTLVALSLTNELAVTFVGNLLADVAFFAIVLSGKSFSEWCVELGRQMYMRVRAISPLRFARIGMAAAMTTVGIAGILMLPSTLRPTVSGTMLHIGGNYGVPALLVQLPE